MFTLAAPLKAKMDGGYDAALDSRIVFFCIETLKERKRRRRCNVEIKKEKKLMPRGVRFAV